MNKKTIGIIVLGLLFFATACVQQDIDPMAQDDSIQASEGGSDDVQLQHEGIGPLEITPDAGGGESTAGQENQVEGIVSSSGEVSTAESKNAEPGYVDSVAPESLAIDQVEVALEWLTYIDPAYSFSIDYPSIYTVLPETEDQSNADPAIVHQVRFQDIQLATGDTAEFELPIFLIEVFELGDKSLDDFIHLNEPDGHTEMYQGNNQNGIRVSYNQLIAPGEYYFFSSQNYAYKLTPLGPFSPDMVLSFDIQ